MWSFFVLLYIRCFPLLHMVLLYTASVTSFMPWDIDGGVTKDENRKSIQCPFLGMWCTLLFGVCILVASGEGGSKPAGGNKAQPLQSPITDGQITQPYRRRKYVAEASAWRHLQVSWCMPWTADILGRSDWINCVAISFSIARCEHAVHFLNYTELHRWLFSRWLPL